MKRITLFLILFLAGLPTASAQTDPTLPDLAPREVEIRGQLQISFPSLERQPLVGFNPPPRIPEIPQGRIPFVGEYKQESIDLPPSPLQAPEAPEISSLAGKTPLTGAVEAGAGVYLSRFMRASVGAPLSNTETLLLKVDYDGTNGHKPFDGVPDADSPYNDIEGALALQTVRSSLAAGAEIGAFSDQYSLYGTEGGTSGALLPFPDRNGRGAHTTLWLRSQSSAPLDFDINLNYAATRFETDAFDLALRQDPVTIRLERRVGVDAALAAPLPVGDALLDFQGVTAGLDEGGLTGSTVQSYNLGAGYRFYRGEAYAISIGARLMGLKAEAQNLYGARRRFVYLSPDVRVDYYPQQGVNVFVQNRPGTTFNGLRDLYQLHPYLIDEPDLQPTMRSIDAEAGARLFYGNVQVSLKGGYVRSPNYLYFEQRTGPEAYGYTRGLSAPLYNRARIIHADAEASLVLLGGLHATIGLSFRDGHLTDEDVDIPYFAAITGKTLVGYAFDGGQGLVQVAGNFNGARDLDRLGTGRLGASFDLDIKASYFLSDQWGLVVRADNLSPRREQWDHYPEAPLMIMGGLQVRW